MKTKDQLHREIHLETTPKRIISLVPSQTELLYDLGLEDSIVGITKFCVHPYHLKSTKTIVGGTKNIKLDKIVALQPDIILSNKEENTKEIVETLEKLVPVHVSDVKNIEESLEMIKQYGTIFKCTTEASKINAKIEFNLVVERYLDSNKRSDAMLKLAMVEQKLNSNASAKTWYEKVLSEYPESSAAQLAQARLNNL